MNNSAHFSLKKPVFHGNHSPEEGWIVGYAAIIDTLALPMPMVNPIVLVCDQNKNERTDKWLILPKSYLPVDHLQINDIEALIQSFGVCA